MKLKINLLLLLLQILEPVLTLAGSAVPNLWRSDVVYRYYFAKSSLKTWYESIQTKIGKITKSGSATKTLTNRDKYLKKKLSFLGDHIVRQPSRVAMSLKSRLQPPPTTSSVAETWTHRPWWRHGTGSSGRFAANSVANSDANSDANWAAKSTTVSSGASSSVTDPLEIESLHRTSCWCGRIDDHTTQSARPECADPGSSQSSIKLSPQPLWGSWIGAMSEDTRHCCRTFLQTALHLSCATWMTATAWKKQPQQQGKQQTQQPLYKFINKNVFVTNLSWSKTLVDGQLQNLVCRWHSTTKVLKSEVIEGPYNLSNSIKFVKGLHLSWS